MASDGKESYGFPMETSLNYKSSGPTPASSWQSAVADASAMNIQEGPMRVPTSSESISSSFLSLGWESNMEQGMVAPFQSSLGSVVAPLPAATTSLSSDGSIVMRELIGRLGANLCNTGGGVSCSSPALGSTMDTVLNLVTTWNPLNSNPNLNLGVDPSKGAFSMEGGTTLPPPHSLAQFSSDPGFAERAARFSCFGNRNYSDLSNPFNFPEAEPSYRSSTADNCQIPRVPSNQSLKAGLPINLSNMGEMKGSSGSEPTQDGAEAELRMTDRKFSRLSRSSTPVSTDDMRQRHGMSGNESDEAELSTGREETSSSDHVAGRGPGSKSLNEINGRKRKMLSKAKSKDAPSFVGSPGGRETKGLEAEDSQGKRFKVAEAGSKEKDDLKPKAEQNSNGNSENSQKQTKDNVKVAEPPKDYIHVRARRGQATDSHSLAERVRREKISERMKFLQDLVPGCSKVTGKAVMLDEIINYVQSLQRQVEFLSMKLATVNPRLDFNMEGLIAKDMLQSRNSSSRMLFAPDHSAAFPQLHHQQLCPVQVSVACATEGHGMGNPVEAALRRTVNTQPLFIDGYEDSISQIANIWDEDLQSVVQMGFGQNKQGPLTSQGIHGPLPTNQMKIEL
ncbi:hypothetical protein SUGI_0523740 [Cryptomeria japonica]|uniref:transcription factor bHLH62 n=1 Tax=Cryptomeria japonica TaxID=3369 RepID=UPI002408A142|nr:transcription factor bHLH62 [Cryptomeria japonica]GLJ26823.1 hypothetical protein SUGI_0523740 [Cryptomeria japonica]